MHSLPSSIQEEDTGLGRDGLNSPSKEKSGVVADEELTSQHAINDSQFPDSAANTDSAAEAAPATTGQ